MNEIQFRKEEIKNMPNRLATMGNYDQDISPEAASEFQETPNIAERLKITEFLIEPSIMTKAQGVEKFLKEQSEKEGLREGKIGYETILQRLLDRLPEPYEFMMRNKQGLKVLDFLFGEAAILNKLSTQTYLQKVGEDIKSSRIAFLLSKLKSELAII